jgi:hypothetical protein
MSRTHPAALMTLLALTVTSLAGAQQASSDTARHAKPSPGRDQRQDQRTISADSIKLHHDIALRDSVGSALEADHDRVHADQARLDSLRPALAAARKATPRDSAAIKRDLAALDRAKAALDRDLDQGKREEVRLAALKKRADQESDAIKSARNDLRVDRSGQKQANGTRRDERQDAHALSADSATLRRDIAMRDSARSALEADHDRIHADQGRLDSLRTALANTRKADPRDTVAIARDVKALNQAKQALDRDLDRGKQEQSLLASMNRKVTKETDVTADARHDLRSDRSALEHPSAKSHRR